MSVKDHVARAAEALVDARNDLLVELAQLDEQIAVLTKYVGGHKTSKPAASPGKNHVAYGSSKGMSPRVLEFLEKRAAPVKWEQLVRIFSATTDNDTRVLRNAIAYLRKQKRIEPTAEGWIVVKGPKKTREHNSDMTINFAETLRRTVDGKELTVPEVYEATKEEFHDKWPAIARDSSQARSKVSSYLAALASTGQIFRAREGVYKL